MIKFKELPDDILWRVLIAHIHHEYCNEPDYCMQCKFAHPLATKLYTCDDDEESLVYCEKHEVFCREQRPVCDWAAISVK